MKESQNIEWKESWRDEYIKWICGFANAQGGTLIIGKNNKGMVTGVAPPKFNCDFSGLMVEFEAKVEKVSGKTSGKVSGKTSGKILELMKSNSSITIPELALKIGVTDRSIERNIQNLQKEGIIQRIGPAKGGHWEVIIKK